MKTPKYELGSWIRFYNMGKMCIDQVQYIDHSVIEVEYLTIHNGHVSEDCVLEARTAKVKEIEK